MIWEQNLLSTLLIPSTTSDSSQIERVSEMLNDIWKRGIEISEISSQAGTKLPLVEVTTTDTVTKIVAKMLQNSVTSVLITENKQPIGVVNDKDILWDIVEGNKDPKKTLAKNLNFTPLIILQGNESMVTAMKTMEEKGIKRAAMVKNGQLIGMLKENISKTAASKTKVPA